MIDVRVDKEITLEAPAERVWGLLADFGSIGDWWPAGLLDKVECDGDGVGMTRHMHVVGGMVLSERLDALHPDERKLELSITGDLPGTVTGYGAWGKVHELGPDRCRVEWHGSFQIEGAEEEAGARAFFEGAYTGMFAGLQGAVEAR